MAARTWTPEQRQRQRQAEAIRRWSPRKQSTEPKSEAGKAMVAGNACTGGEWRKLRDAIKGLNQAMRDQRDML